MSRSHVSESVSSYSASLTNVGTKPFCVVCGSFREDLVARSSGFKCPKCVGKKGNRQWVKLQKKQAAQLYTEAIQQQQQQNEQLKILTQQQSINSGISGGEDSNIRTSKDLTSHRDPINSYVDETDVFKRVVGAEDSLSINDSFSSPMTSSHTANTNQQQPYSPPVMATATLPVHTVHKNSNKFNQADAVASSPGGHSLCSDTRTHPTPDGNHNDAHLAKSTGEPKLPPRRAKAPGAAADGKSTSSTSPRPPPPLRVPPRHTDVHSLTERPKTPRSRVSVSFNNSYNSLAAGEEVAGRGSGKSQTGGAEVDSTNGDTNHPTAATTTTIVTNTTAERHSVHNNSVHSPTVVQIDENCISEDDRLSLSRRTNRAAAATSAPAAEGYTPPKSPCDGSRSSRVTLTSPDATKGGRKENLGNSGTATPTNGGRSRKNSHSQSMGINEISDCNFVDPLNCTNPYELLPNMRGNAEEFSYGSSCDSSQCSSSSCASDRGGDGEGDASFEVQQQDSYEEGSNSNQPSLDRFRRGRDDEDVTLTVTETDGSVQTFNLSSLVITVKIVTAIDMERSKRVQQKKKIASSSGNGGHPLALKKSELSASLGDSRGSSKAREGSAPRPQVVRQGKFTVTRQMPVHERSISGVSLVSTGSGSGERCGSVENSAISRSSAMRVEVKKMCFDFELKDAEKDIVFQTVRRRYFTEIIPFCDAIKKLAGPDVPAVPSKRVPSLRFATEAFLEERRAEVQLFFDHLGLNVTLMQSPKTIQILKLEKYVQSNRTSATHSRRSSIPSSQDTMSNSNPNQNHNSNSNSNEQMLNSAALDKLREKQHAFLRSDSNTSGHSSRSSIVRRSRLDKVAPEDLEQVQLGNTIGRGSFGVVSQGLLQTTSGPLVIAVKVMQVGQDVDSDTLGSAQEELDILRAAKHKNVIRFLGSIYRPELHELHIFTEYVECGTIRSMVDRFGCLPLLAIQKYMQQIFLGLSHLHSLSIVHRDIKGENILVTKNGKVKLTDFGCSGVINDINMATMKKDGDKDEGTTPSPAPSAGPVGSPLWMAPEVIHGANPGKAADVWAVGCVGLEMLDREIWSFGNTARGNGNPFLFMFKIGKAGTPPHGYPSEEEMQALPTKYNAAEMKDLELYRDFLTHCFQIDPEKRWNAEQLLKHPFMGAKLPKYLRWMPDDAIVGGTQ